MKKLFRLLPVLAILAVLTIIPSGGAWAQGEPEPLRFGTLPVIQALPLFVAAEMGLFKAEGLEVDLVPFRTAMEKEAAMTAGQIDGYFGDLFTPIILRAAGVDLRIVARNFTTGRGQRMFAVVAGPKSGINNIEDLASVPVAVSTNTIIEYVTRTLMKQGGVTGDQVQFLEAKNIPLRFQMLMSGQVEAATLPEPLVTLAEKKGARVLADDGRTELSSTVLVFNRKALTRRPDDVIRFLTALGHAVLVINSGNNGVRDIMIKNCNVPEPLRDTYPLPEFPSPGVPDRKTVEGAVSWLSSRGALKTQPSYSSLVDAGFIP